MDVAGSAMKASYIGLGGARTAAQSGSNVGGVDPHLFCNTGVMTPICK